MNSTEYVNSLFNLEGHVGIITGATRGLGMGQAKVLTDAGATVYNFSRSPRSNEEVITGKMTDVQVDMTHDDAVQKAIDEIIKKEGHLDFLINNAGMTFKSKAEEFPMDMLHANVYYEQTYLGLILLLAVSLDSIKQILDEKKLKKELKDKFTAKA